MNLLLRTIGMMLVVFIWPDFLMGQQVKIVDYATIEKEFSKATDTLKIVNFWATSCKPCIEEFPFFIDAQKEFEDSKVKFLYVSLDFSKQLDKVQEFVSKRALKGKHFLLKDDPNIWINMVDENWGGDIPYTLLVKKDLKRVRHNSKFNSSQEIISLITNHL